MNEKQTEASQKEREELALEQAILTEPPVLWTEEEVKRATALAVELQAMYAEKRSPLVMLGLVDRGTGVQVHALCLLAKPMQELIDNSGVMGMTFVQMSRMLGAAQAHAGETGSLDPEA